MQPKNCETITKPYGDGSFIVETHAENIALAIVKYYGSPPQARMTAEMAFLAWNRGTTRERFAALDIATLTDQEHEAARVNALLDGTKEK